MTVTDINVRKLFDGKKLRAIVSVTFDGVFVLHDVKVIEGYEKTFVAMPCKKNADGTFSDVAHPLTSAFRKELEEKVIEAYKKASV